MTRDRSLRRAEEHLQWWDTVHCVSACWLSISRLNGWWGTRYRVEEPPRTEVVLTPQSNSGVVDEGAGGVSTHSKFSSEVLLLILRTTGEFCKLRSIGVDGSFGRLAAVSLSEH